MDILSKADLDRVFRRSEDQRWERNRANDRAEQVIPAGAWFAAKHAEIYGSW